MAMRPILIAQLFGLTLFALYLAFGFAHTTDQGSPTRASMRYEPE
jgi:hypothetical protein